MANRTIAQRIKHREDMFLRRFFGVLARMAKVDGKVDAWEAHAAESAFARFPRAMARRKFCVSVFNSSKNGRTPLCSLAAEFEKEWAAPEDCLAKIVHYQIRVGIDSDNDGELSYSESVPLEVYKYQGQLRYAGICGTTSARCDAFDVLTDVSKVYINLSSIQHLGCCIPLLLLSRHESEDVVLPYVVMGHADSDLKRELKGKTVNFEQFEKIFLRLLNLISIIQSDLLTGFKN